MSSFDYRRYGILYIDPDPATLHLVTETLAHRFRVLTATNFPEALQRLSSDDLEIGIVLCGRAMTDPTGKPFLSLVREASPEVLRIVLNSPGESALSPEALLANDLYLALSLPWTPASLEIVLLRAMEHLLLRKERDLLFEEKAVVFHRLLLTDRALGLGSLATDLSHRLRHVMPALQSFLEVAEPTLQVTPEILEGLRSAPPWKACSKHSRSQLGFLSNLLGEIRDSARPSQPTFNDQVQAHVCFSSAFERHKTRLMERRFKITNGIPKNLPTLKCDAVLLDRMMDALFEEALLLLPPDTSIRIDGVKETDQVVRFQFACDEPGMRTEGLRWIFDPLLTLPVGEPRPGVNLLTAFLVVYHHGGVVHQNLQAGHGRVLRFHFPVDPDKLAVTDQGLNFLNRMILSDDTWDEWIGRS